jgi:hypothetical protein
MEDNKVRKPPEIQIYLGTAPQKEFASFVPFAVKSTPLP